MTLDIQPDPPSVSQSTLIFTLVDAEGTSIEGAALGVKGDMNPAGMEPIVLEAESGPDGTAEVPFEWTIGGDWIVTMGVALSDGTPLLGALS